MIQPSIAICGIYLDIINNELTKVSEWLAANKLSLNVKKTKYMVFHTPQRKVTYPEIKINNISKFSFLPLFLILILNGIPILITLLKKYWNCWTIMEVKRPISDDCVTDAV